MRNEREWERAMRKFMEERNYFFSSFFLRERPIWRGLKILLSFSREKASELHWREDIFANIWAALCTFLCKFKGLKASEREKESDRGKKRNHFHLRQGPLMLITTSCFMRANLFLAASQVSFESHYVLICWPGKSNIKLTMKNLHSKRALITITEGEAKN